MKAYMLILLCCPFIAYTQSIGLLTNSPQAPVHIWGQGQVQTLGGLLLIGSRTEGHLEMDYDRIQSNFGVLSSLPLRIQPDGGNVGIGVPFPNSIDHTLHVDGNVGINFLLAHNGDSDTWLRFSTDDITLTAGGRQFLRMSEEDALDEMTLAGGGDVEVDIGAGRLFIEGTTGHIGINETSPNSRLHVDAESSENPLRVQRAGSTKFIIASDDQVGIGDLSPDARLDVNGSGGEPAFIVDQSSVNKFIVASDGQVGVGTTTPDARLEVDSDPGEAAFRVRQDGSTKFFIHENGRNGMGNVYFAPDNTLHVRHSSTHSENEGLAVGNGTDRWVYFSNSNNNLSLYADNGPTYALHGTFLWGPGDYVPFSDRREKKNIESLQPVLDRVVQLKPSKYRMQIEEATAQKSIGFIAQDVKDLFPENVRYLDDQDRYVILYKGFSVVAIKAIQELNEVVESQQELISELQRNQKALMERLERLERLE